MVAQYAATGAELNVLPFCSQFIPMEVIDHPKHGSIIYHPSLLPRHRGASAINWWVQKNDAREKEKQMRRMWVVLLAWIFFFFFLPAAIYTQDPDPWRQKGRVHSVLG